MTRVKATTFQAVAELFKLPPDVAHRYVFYMKTRWGHQEDLQCRTGYAQEWALRFKSGAEYQHSDTEGRRLLRDMLLRGDTDAAGTAS